MRCRMDIITVITFPTFCRAACGCWATLKQAVEAAGHCLVEATELGNRPRLPMHGMQSVTYLRTGDWLMTGQLVDRLKYLCR